MSSMVMPTILPGSWTYGRSGTIPGPATPTGSLSGRKRPSNAAPLAAIGLGAALLLSACAEAPGLADRLTLTPIGFAGLPGWGGDAVAAAILPLRLSCDRRARAAEAPSGGGESIGGSPAEWDRICAAAYRLAIGDDARARAFFERHFKPYRASNGGDARGLFTGYYEAELKGALRPTAPNLEWV